MPEKTPSHPDYAHDAHHSHLFVSLDAEPLQTSNTSLEVLTSTIP
jgi:hypothetical protein